MLSLLQQFLLTGFSLSHTDRSDSSQSQLAQGSGPYFANRTIYVRLHITPFADGSTITRTETITPPANSILDKRQAQATSIPSNGTIIVAESLFDYSSISPIQVAPKTSQQAPAPPPLPSTPPAAPVVSPKPADTPDPPPVISTIDVPSIVVTPSPSPVAPVPAVNTLSSLVVAPSAGMSPSPADPSSEVSPPNQPHLSLPSPNPPPNSLRSSVPPSALTPTAPAPSSSASGQVETIATSQITVPPNSVPSVQSIAISSASLSASNPSSNLISAVTAISNSNPGGRQSAIVAASANTMPSVSIYALPSDAPASSRPSARIPESASPGLVASQFSQSSQTNLVLASSAGPAASPGQSQSSVSLQSNTSRPTAAVSGPLSRTSASMNTISNSARPGSVSPSQSAQPNSSAKLSSTVNTSSSKTEPSNTLSASRTTNSPSLTTITRSSSPSLSLASSSSTSNDVGNLIWCGLGGCTSGSTRAPSSTTSATSGGQVLVARGKIVMFVTSLLGMILQVI